MNDLKALKSQLIKALAAKPVLAGCDVIEAFPGQRFDPGRAAIAVGLSAVELSPAGLGGFPQGQSRQNPTAATITMRLDLYSPGKDGRELHSLYESLCCALLEEAAKIGLAGISCEALRRDGVAGAWRLPAKAVLHGVIVGAKQLSAADSGSVTHFTLRSEPHV